MSDLSQRYLVVGLGNPGTRYENTRHNMGYKVVQAFAKKHGWEFQKNQKLQGYLAKGAIGDKQILLLMPFDYINNSGRSVRLTVDYYEVSQDRLLIAVDDAAIDFGCVRLKEFGSSGGHNGLKDIQAHLGSQNYPRLRVGIGHPGYGDLDEHVLGKFTSEEKKDLPEIIQMAIEAVEKWVESGIKIAMNFANQRPSEIPEEREVGEKKNETNPDTSL